MDGRLLATLLCALLAGCSAHTNVRIGSGAAGVPPGTSVTSSSVGASVQSGSAAGALIAIGLLAAAWHGAGSDRVSGRHGAEPFSAIVGPVPPLDETRRVHEQDCTRPIEDASANLKCK
jgi:hypothetical protein